jgi:hypothetical protein
VPRSRSWLELALEPVRPNPTRGPIRLGYALPREAQVRLSIFDLQGREIAVPASGLQPAGLHAAEWFGAAAAPAGLYLARLSTPAGTVVRRIVILRGRGSACDLRAGTLGTLG